MVDPGAGGEVRAERLLLYGAFAVAVVLTFAATPDDSFITLRYAHNLLHGYGPVFNPGQHVDGATSPAGLALAAVALLIPVGPALLKAKLLSLLFGLLTVRAGGRLVAVMRVPRPVHIAGLLLVGISPIVAFQSATGLETTIASFAVTSLLVEVTSGRAMTDLWRAGLFAALAVAARPEAILVGVAVALVAALSGKRPWWFVGSAVAEVAILTANRTYYGTFLPNTYAAKAVPLDRDTIKAGLRYVVTALDPAYYSASSIHRVGQLCLVGLDLLLAIGVVVALARWRRHGVLLGAVVAQVAFTVRSGGDWMLGARFLAPVAPALIGLVLLGVVALGGMLSRVRLARLLPAVLVATVAATAIPYLEPLGRAPITALDGVSDRQLIAHGSYGVYSTIWASSPRYLACARAGEWVATSESGYGPFAESQLRVLDVRGLTDREIATTAPASMKSDVGVTDLGWTSPTSPVGRAILERQPVLIVTLDGTPRSSVLDGRYHLIEAPRYGATLYLSVYARSGFACPSQ